MGQGNKYQSQGATRASGVSHTRQRGRSIGRGRGKSVQVGSSRAQGRVYAVTQQTEAADHLVI